MRWMQFSSIKSKCEDLLFLRLTFFLHKVEQNFSELILSTQIVLKINKKRKDIQTDKNQVSYFGLLIKECTDTYSKLLTKRF